MIKGEAVPFPFDVPATYRPPDDVTDFLSRMHQWALSVISSDAICTEHNKDPDYILRCFERFMLSPTFKTSELKWTVYDPSRTKLSYQWWFYYQLDYFLNDNRGRFIKTAPWNPSPKTRPDDDVLLQSS